MRTLPQKFRRHGFDHEVIERCEGVVLVKKTQGSFVGWEVARVFFAEAHTIAGQSIEAGEHLPSMEQWGTYAFSYTNEADARRKFEAMVVQEVMK